MYLTKQSQIYCNQINSSNALINLKVYKKELDAEFIRIIQLFTRSQLNYVLKMIF